MRLIDAEIKEEEVVGRMTCYYCPLSEGVCGLKVVTASNPPKIRCTRTNEYNDLYHKCEFEFNIVRHGHWIPKQTMVRSIFAKNYNCSVCGAESFQFNFCPDCGAVMDETEETSKWQA